MVGRNPNPHIYSSGHLSLIIIKEHLYLKILIIRISSENHLIIPPETRFSTFLMRCFPVWCFKFPCVLTSRHRRADAKARHRGDLGQEILHLWLRHRQRLRAKKDVRWTPIHCEWTYVVNMNLLMNIYVLLYGILMNWGKNINISNWRTFIVLSLYWLLAIINTQRNIMIILTMYILIINDHCQVSWLLLLRLSSCL